MFSPDSSITMRTVPCIAGWEGPTLSIIGSLGSSSSLSSSSRSRGSITRASVSLVLAGPVRLPAEAHALVGAEGRDLLEALAIRNERLRPVGRIVLPQRMPDELRVQEDAPEIGMAAEDDAHH